MGSVENSYILDGLRLAASSQVVDIIWEMPVGMVIARF